MALSLLPPDVSAPVAAVPMRTRWIPGGDAGILLTVSAMRRLARQAAVDRGVQVLTQVAVGDATDPAAQWANLRQWLAVHTHFQSDPVAVELVRTPWRQFQRIRNDGVMRGDCDDVATLAAAMTLALGRRARFVVLGFVVPGPAAPYRHVYAEMETAPGVWRDFDVTRRKASLPASRRTTVEA